MEYVTKVIDSKVIAKNIVKIKIEKPENYKYVPGFSASFTINKKDLTEFKKPITFTSIPEDQYLEIMVKKYSNSGLSGEFFNLKEGDQIILTSPYGKFRYSGPGTFIAGGIGITPFISIMRELKIENKSFEVAKLIYSNKTSVEVVAKDELQDFFKENLFLTLTQEKKPGFDFGRINKDYLKKAKVNLDEYFYICGPLPFVKKLREILKDLGVSKEKIIG